MGGKLALFVSGYLTRTAKTSKWRHVSIRQSLSKLASTHNLREG